MAVVIRMKRTGRRNRPCYRISVADGRAPRDGRTLETLGLYDPISPKPESQHTLNVERARYWLSKGAQPSATVHSLFKKHEVYEGDLALRPQDPKRRPGRKKATSARQRRQAAKTARSEAKTTRRQERADVRSAARKAAAVEAAADSDA